MGARDKIMLTVTEKLWFLFYQYLHLYRNMHYSAMLAAGMEKHTGHRALVRPGACW